MTIVHVISIGESITRGELKHDAVNDVLGSTYFKNGSARGGLCWATDPVTRVLNVAAVGVDSEAQEALTAPNQEGYCAEWTSTYLDARDAPSGREECHVLLASDTNDGLRAAVLVAARYANGGPVRYVDDPHDLVAPRTGQVWLVRVPELDLGRRDPTDDTWRGLGRVGRVVADALADDRPAGAVFHLSGGYKAVLPYWLTVADAVATAVRVENEEDPPAVRAVAVHDSTQQAIRAGGAGNPALSPTQLPVRWWSGRPLHLARQLSAELRTRPAGDVLSDVHYDDLAGQLVEGPRRHRALRPEGHILTETLHGLG